MMKSMLSLSLALSLGLGAAACSKKEEAAAAPSGGGAGAPSEKAAAPAAKAGSAVKLDALKLQFDGPSGLDISDMSMGGPLTLLVSGNVVFTIGELGPTSPKNLEEAVEATKMYNDVTITKQEKTADGYQLEWNNKGSMGANYTVELRRDIGGRPVHCGTTAATPELAAAALKACQSVRPL